MAFIRPTPLLRLIAHNRSSNAYIVAPYHPLRNSSTSHTIGHVSYLRRYATTLDSGSQTTQAVLLKGPRRDELDMDDEFELLSGDEARLAMTERAAEKLNVISKEDQDCLLSLRIAVESGGCHGYQYKMELTSERLPEDYLFVHPVESRSSIIVDAVSLGLLKGSTIDYATELIGSSFRIIDNPQAKGTGCGCGVSWEANI